MRLSIPSVLNSEATRGLDQSAARKKLAAAQAPSSELPPFVIHDIDDPVTQLLVSSGCVSVIHQKRNLTEPDALQQKKHSRRHDGQAGETGGFWGQPPPDFG
jgi:hypothetical protein